MTIPGDPMWKVNKKTRELQAYSPDQPRDEKGRWAAELSDMHSALLQHGFEHESGNVHETGTGKNFYSDWRSGLEAVVKTLPSGQPVYKVALNDARYIPGDRSGYGNKIVDKGTTAQQLDTYLKDSLEWHKQDYGEEK